MALKAGTVGDYDGSMAAEIETAMKAQWEATKQFAFPPDGHEDRQILFCAIAQGVLSYLKDHQDEVLSSITLQRPGGPKAKFDVVALDLNVGS
jgi:hypothetical protein